jgi:hypothetical protein
MLSEGAVTLSPPIEVAAAEYSVFGQPGPDGPEPPGDPMTELVAVPGDPVELSERCQRRARRFELLSGAILVAGLVINLIWVFAAFQYLVR